MGPNELSWMAAALAMLAESGLSPKERHHAFLAIIGHVAIISLTDYRFSSVAFPSAPLALSCQARTEVRDVP
jgi:hypothetical protein